MQINKKLITTTLTALLLLSMLAAAAPAFAVTAPVLSVPNGTVGTTITVSGLAGAAAAGGTVTIYWDLLASTPLNTTTALGDGSYSVLVKIPDAKQGQHFIIAQDASGSAGTAFTVDPKITLSATTGIPGDAVVVTGTGFAGTVTGTHIAANVTFAGTDITPVALQFTSATGNFSITITVPTLPYLNYAVRAEVNNTAAVPNVGNLFAVATGGFTIGAAITLSPKNGPPGTIVTITGRGLVAANWVSLAVTAPAGAGIPSPIANLTVLRTAADGTFSGTFVVPSLTAGAKTITATEGTYLPTATFTVIGVTKLTASPTSASPGATVTVTGTNFTAIAGTVVTVKFSTFTVGTFTTNSAGGFSGAITVPSLPTGPYTLQAVDANVLNATITPNFNIAITNLFASASTGPTGTVITLTSFGFTVGVLANVTFGVYQVLTFVTDASLQAGTAQFMVPTVPTGTYTITVTDDALFTASTTFTVNATSTLVVNPSTAPTGYTNIALRVTNFAATDTIRFYITNSTYSRELTFVLDALQPTAPFVLLQTNANGALNASFTVPALALGSYTIVANETTFGLYNATQAFTIGTATLTVTTRATTYSQGDTVSFNIQSSFPDDMQINVYDPDGTPMIITIESAQFYQLGTIFVVPYSYLGYFGADGLWSDHTGSVFLLPSDAVVGTWTWNATLLTLLTTKNGTFTVTASSTALLTAINQTVTQTNSTVNTVNSTVTTIKTNLGLMNATLVSIQGDVAIIKTSVGTTLTTSISNIQATLTSIQGSIATISTPDLGSITAKLNSIDAIIGYVANDTTNIVTSLGSITTSLSSIGTTVTSISGNVATIQTDLGTLSGTITSVTNSGIATIQTSLGTIQIDISAIQTGISGLQTGLGTVQSDVASSKSASESLSPLIIVAIVLALIAAIAAIASIVLMRRKIAG